MNKEERLQLEKECLIKHSKAQMIQKYIDEFEENITLKINYLLSLPASEAVKSALLNLKWVLEIYQEEKIKGRRR